MRNEARTRAAVMFSGVAALGVILFEFLFELSTYALVAYGSVIIAAALFGAIFGSWYLRKASPIALIVTPLLVLTCAALAAGQLQSFLSHYVGGYDFPPPPLMERLGQGVFMSLMYLLVASPIIIPTAAIASFSLWRRYRHVEGTSEN